MRIDELWPEEDAEPRPPVVHVTQTLLYTITNWIIVVLLGLFIGGVVGLFLIGCNNPTAPSEIGSKKVTPVPTLVRGM